MIDKACVVITTAPNQEQAKTMARSVLEARLAACAQIQAIQSLYWWDGKIAEDDEHLIMFKTTVDRYSEIERVILSVHPYETPEIIQLPVEAGYAKYLSWIARETRRPV
jgi:periplasmic divalent cation tolerance protein